MTNNKLSLAEIAARSRVKNMNWEEISDKFSKAGDKFAKAYGGWRDSKRRASGNFTEEESNEKEIQEQAVKEKAKEAATEGLNPKDTITVETELEKTNDWKNSLKPQEYVEIKTDQQEKEIEENESLNLQTFTDIDGNKIK